MSNMCKKQAVLVMERQMVVLMELIQKVVHMALTFYLIRLICFKRMLEESVERFLTFENFEL